MYLGASEEPLEASCEKQKQNRARDLSCTGMLVCKLARSNSQDFVSATVERHFHVKTV
jgi:hypothetical protein